MLNNKERQLKEPANLSHQNSAALHVALYGIRLLYKLKFPFCLHRPQKPACNILLFWFSPYLNRACQYIKERSALNAFTMIYA